MLGTGLTYQVHYIANDGTMCSFKFQTDRSFRTYRNNNYASGTFVGQPFMNDLCEAAKGFSANPDSRMSKHGGFAYYSIRRIKCIETGETKLFCI